jgi:hypothetical protein
MEPPVEIVVSDEAPAVTLPPEGFITSNGDVVCYDYDVESNVIGWHMEAKS